MPLRTARLLSAAIALAVASCAGGEGDSGGAEGSSAAMGAQPEQVARVRSGDMFDDDSQKILGRYGAVNPQYGAGGEAASESGTVENKQFEGRFGKREFHADRHEKPAFWGSKDYTKKVYAGDLDGSRFQSAAKMADKGARENTMISREGGRIFETAAIASPVAREASRSAVERGSDAETDLRRERFQQPEVRDFNQQRALTVEDTKGMLGR